MANKKRLGVVVGIGMLSLMITAGVLVGKEAKHKGSEEGSGKGHGKQHMMCSMKIDGADVKVINTDNGVTIHITAEDSKVVKEIQTATANMVKKGCCPKHLGKAHEGKGKKEAVYICPMGEKCYEGPKTKDGRCPECGMKLKKDKTQKECKCKKEKTEKKGCKCKKDKTEKKGCKCKH